MEEDRFTLDGRVLCSDDNCIGLVGADGKCKICGLVYTGNEALPTCSDNVEAEPSSEAQEPTQEMPESQRNEDSAEEIDPLERICCPDDTCIGIIGEDGVCGTCGKSR